MMTEKNEPLIIGENCFPDAVELPKEQKVVGFYAIQNLPNNVTIVGYTDSGEEDGEA